MHKQFPEGPWRFWGPGPVDSIIPPAAFPTHSQTTSTPKARTCQLSINFKKTFLNYTIAQNIQLPDNLVSIDTIQRQMFPLTVACNVFTVSYKTNF